MRLNSGLDGEWFLGIAVNLSRIHEFKFIEELVIQIETSWKRANLYEETSHIWTVFKNNLHPM